MDWPRHVCFQDICIYYLYMYGGLAKEPRIVAHSIARRSFHPSYLLRNQRDGGQRGEFVLED
jgi:hypothetical protein